MRLWFTWRELRTPGAVDLARSAGYEIMVIPSRRQLIHKGKKP